MDIILDALRAAVGVQAAVFALGGVGLNLQFGYAGLLNFGVVAFFLVGSYSVAITVDAGGSLWLGILVGVGGAVLLGLLFGLPTLRLRADYLAIVTISAGEILRLLVRSSTAEPLTNGVFGYNDFARSFLRLNPIPTGRYGIGAFAFSERALWIILVGWTLVALASVFVWWLMRSPWGRVIRGLREDEDAVRALGKNVFAYKLQALAIGGVIAAVAGMLRAFDTQAVRPDFFITALTFTVYAAVILGGAGTIIGPIVGSMALWGLIALSDGLLRELVEARWLDWLGSEDIAPVRFMIVGLALILLVVFRPQGLMGRKDAGLLDE